MEKQEVTGTRREAIDLLAKAGNLTKPYNSRVLGSFSMHIYAQPNINTGNVDIGFQTISTDMDIKADILQGLLKPMKDMVDRIVGATRFEARTTDKSDQEERIENRIKMQELGLIDPVN